MFTNATYRDSMTQPSLRGIAHAGLMGVASACRVAPTGNGLTNSSTSFHDPGVVPATDG